ncbi:hypothetical protein K438DRAFT_851881 [Mycena galopus ATCC 62051]|nr:hypothetical protein K438DRAFT_851881 [Mycena galopus ATCC 62051]
MGAVVVLITSTEPPHCPPTTPTGKDMEGGRVEQGLSSSVASYMSLPTSFSTARPHFARTIFVQVRLASYRLDGGQARHGHHRITDDEGGATPDPVEQMQKEAPKETPQGHLAAPALAMCACRTAQTAIHSLSTSPVNSRREGYALAVCGLILWLLVSGWGTSGLHLHLDVRKTHLPFSRVDDVMLSSFFFFLPLRKGRGGGRARESEVFAGGGEPRLCAEEGRGAGTTAQRRE